MPTADGKDRAPRICDDKRAEQPIATEYRRLTHTTEPTTINHEYERQQC